MTIEVDTIVAVATGPGGALSLVRLSGPRSHAILRGLSGPEASEPESRVATLRTLRDPEGGAPIDQAVVVRYDAPDSYTGEDVVELSCHGGWLVPGLVVDACRALGARAAEPGEFTRRAYLNGKLDLLQAEAVADLVAAGSQALHRAALGQLERGLSRRVADLRSHLVRLEALLAHHLDFPEEDDAPVPVDRIAGEAATLAERMEGLLATAPEGELLREGAVVVFAGAPNVGKSSLFNALIGEERAIVTARPGTTRDALESVIQLEGFPFRLVDTAGMRDSSDEVERLGMEVALRHLAQADLILLCADREPGPEEMSFLALAPPVAIVLVRTKSDLSGARGASATPEGCTESVDVSVVTGEGLARLKGVLPKLVYGGMVSVGTHQPVITRRRQARALGRARDEVRAFEGALRTGVPAEVASVHLRQAEDALEDLLGVVSVDEVLEAVFSEFCIGK